VLRLLVRRRRSEFAKDVELLVLWHQLAVLGREETAALAADSLSCAALRRSRDCFHRAGRHGFVVTPQTLRLWHRELGRRRWAQPRRAAGRAPTDCRVREFALRFARENSGWGYARIAGELPSAAKADGASWPHLPSLVGDVVDRATGGVLE
jgi:putative transposase